MNYSSEKISKSVEKLTGTSIDYIRTTPLSELRRYFEARSEKSSSVGGVEIKVIEVLGMKIRVI